MTETGQSEAEAVAPFDGGPFSRLPLLARLWMQSGLRRAALFGLIAWVPLVILAAAQGNALLSGPPTRASLLCDVGAYARYLIALPLLVYAETFSTPMLNRIAWEFGKVRLIGEADRIKYEETLASTYRLLNARSGSVVMAVVVLFQVILMRRTLAPSFEATWRMMPGENVSILTLAGWWDALVSHPLYLFVLYSWLWRLFLWARLLWKIARFDLVLVPCHPDGAGGIGFLGSSLIALRLFALGVACTAAGPVANQVLLEGKDIMDFQYPIVGLGVVLIGLLIGPLLFFIPNLRAGRRRATFEYGALVMAVGRAWERRWIGVPPDQVVEASPLEAPDFSATVDMLQTVDFAGKIRLVPFTRKGVGTLMLVILAPFVPLLLTKVPLEKMVDLLTKLIL